MRVEQKLDGNDERTRYEWLRAVGIVAAGFLVAWATLAYAGWRQFATWSITATPFAFHSVVIVHLLCILPLTLWGGAWLSGRWRGRWWPLAGWALIGVLVAAVSILSASSIESRARSLSLGTLHALRLVWVFALMLPWSVSAAIAFQRWSATYDDRAMPKDRTRPDDRAPAKGLWLADGVIAFLFAILPIFYVGQVAHRQTVLFSDAQVNQLDFRAWRICQRLNELGIPTVTGQTTSEIAKRYQAEIVNVFHQLQRPLPSDATREQRLERARQLYSLERFEACEHVLRELSEDPEARLRLALSAEAQRKFNLAAERYDAVTVRLRERPELNADQLRWLRIAFERRVNNLRRVGKYRQAESELLEGLDQWPQVQDALLLQLAYHYQMAGRSRESMDYFQRAAELNPRLESHAEAAREKMKLEAGGCLLRPTRAATR